MNTTIDTSRIDRMELRQQIAALDEARKPLADAVDKIDADKWEKIDAEIAREREIYDRERREREAAFFKRCEEIRAAHGEVPGDPQAALEAHDAHEAYGEAYGFDGGSNAERCCLTGLPLLEGDVLIEDGDGNKALAAAVPGWPVFVDEGDADNDEAAA